MSNGDDNQNNVSPESLNPEQVDALKEIGEALLNEESTAAQVLGVDPSYIESMQQFAHVLYSRGRYEEAALLLKTIIELDETMFYPYLLLGDIALKEGHFDEAVACLHRADKLTDAHPLVSALLGEALLRVEEYPAGLSYLHRAVDVAENPDADFVRRAGLLIYVVGEMMDGEQPGEMEVSESTVGNG